MPMLQKIIQPVVLIILTNTSLFAQDFRKDFDELRKRNSSSTKMHIKMTVEAFNEESLRNAIFSQKADIKRLGVNYWYRFGNTEMLMNNNYLILVDHEYKEITCSRRDVKGETEFFSPMNFNLDSMMNVYGHPKMISKDGDIVNYRFSHSSEIESIDIFMDTKKVELRKMAYHYKDGQLVIIRFEQFDINPQLDENSFKEDRFVIKVNGVLKPSAQFGDFSISSEGL